MLTPWRPRGSFGTTQLHRWLAKGHCVNWSVSDDDVLHYLSIAKPSGGVLLPIEPLNIAWQLDLAIFSGTMNRQWATSRTPMQSKKCGCIINHILLGRSARKGWEI